MKTDIKRFPRVQINSKGNSDLQTANVLSLFDPKRSAQTADAKAFAALMKHIKEVDEKEQTVIMVQVENEPGILGDSRDRSGLAEKAFEGAVPKVLLETLRREEKEGKLNDYIRRNLGDLNKVDLESNPTWEAVFGRSKQTDELFMAYHYATYIERVACAGKAVYPIPHYLNAWMRMEPEDGTVDGPSTGGGAGGQEPGDYPSGGPVETVLDIYQLFAPSLDFLSPDIYTTVYDRSCKQWRHRNQPLFIPEQRRDEYGAIRIWSALGNYQAIGTSPFGIDGAEDENPFTSHFELLGRVSEIIMRARQEGKNMYGLYFDRFEKGGKDPSPTREVIMGDFKLLIERSAVPGHPSPGYGLIIQTSSDKFLFIGAGYQVTFSSTLSNIVYTGILSVYQKEVTDVATGEMRDLRMWGGDETRQGDQVVMPSEEIDMGGWFVEMFIPASTRIAECTAYSV